MKWILRIIPYLILSLALGLLHKELQHLRWEELAHALTVFGWERFAMAVGLLVINYFIWSGYDWTSLRQMKLHVPYVQIFRTTSVAFPITNLVGYSLITGFAIRVKKYSHYGVSMARITQLILFNISTWWTGFLFLCGAAIIHAPDGKLLDLSANATRLLGIGLLSIVAVYLVACWQCNGREFYIRRFHMHLPSLHSGSLKILISVADNLVVAMTMFIFMPATDGVSFARFLAYFLSANLVALLSFVPAGLGVLEGVLLFLFRPFAKDAEILASMVLFRVVHYLIPVFFALVAELGGKAFAHYRGEKK